MTCEILILKPDGTQQLAGTVELNNGKISASPRKGYERMFENILADSHWVNRKLITREDPEAWFRSLPAMYSGSYMRARLVEE